MPAPRRLVAAAACVVLATAQLALARGGDPDPTFNHGQAVNISGGIVYFIAAPAAAGATVTAVASASSVAVRRILEDGTTDPAFGSGGEATLSPPFQTLAVLVQPNGYIVLAGVMPGGWGFTRLTSVGTPDPAFGSAGTSLIAGASGAIRPLSGSTGPMRMSLQALGDGRLVAVAYPIESGASSPAAGHATALRLLASGQPDTSFGGTGVVDGSGAIQWTGPFVDARVLASGVVEIARIVTGGVGISRILPTGALEVTGSGITNTRTPPFPVTADTMPKLHYEADGTLYLATLTDDTVNHQSVLRITRWTSQGTLDRSFGSGGIATAPMIEQMLRQVVAILPTPDGEIIALTSAGKIAKLVGGHLDARFGTGGVATQPYDLVDAAMRPDGYVTLLGFDDPFMLARGWLARIQAVGDVVEFYNTFLDHYFMAMDGAEAAGVDAGAAGPGWQRTARTLRPGGSTPVCRFYGTPGVGPNSHFYTADPTECRQVQDDPGWTLEGTGFYTTRVGSSGCTPPLVPVIRYYDNRAATNDSNHRYVTEDSVRGLMESRGWIREGIVFCAKP